MGKKPGLVSAKSRHQPHIMSNALDQKYQDVPLHPERTPERAQTDDTTFRYGHKVPNRIFCPFTSKFGLLNVAHA